MSLDRKHLDFLSAVKLWQYDGLPLLATLAGRPFCPQIRLSAGVPFFVIDAMLRPLDWPNSKESSFQLDSLEGVADYLRDDGLLRYAPQEFVSCPIGAFRRPSDQAVISFLLPVGKHGEHTETPASYQVFLGKAGIHEFGIAADRWDSEARGNDCFNVLALRCGRFVGGLLTTKTGRAALREEDDRLATSDSSPATEHPAPTDLGRAEAKTVSAAIGDDLHSRDDGKNVPIPRRAQKAFSEWLKATEVKGDMTDDQAREWVVANVYRKEGEHPPSCETWKRNLRRYRELTGMQRNRPGHRSKASRSVVKADQIASSELPAGYRPQDR